MEKANEDNVRNISDIASSCTKLSVNIDSIRKEITALSDSCEELKVTSANIKESVDGDVLTKCAELQERVSSLEGKCESLSNDDAALQKTVDTIVRTKFAELQQSVSSLEGKCESLSNDDAALQKTVDTIVHTKCAKLQNSVSSLEGKCESLLKDDVALQTIMTSLADTCSDIIAQNDSSREFTTDLAETVQILTKNNEESKSAYTNLYDTNVKVNETLSFLAKEAQKSLRRNNANEEALREREEKNNIFQKDLNSSIDSLHELICDLKAAWSQLTDEVGEIENNGDALRKELKVNVADLKLEMKDLNKTVQELDSKSICMESRQDNLSDKFTSVFEDKLKQLQSGQNTIIDANKSLEKRKHFITAMQQLCDGYSKGCSADDALKSVSVGHNCHTTSASSFKKMPDYAEEEHKSNCSSVSQELSYDGNDMSEGLEFEVREELRKFDDSNISLELKIDKYEHSSMHYMHTQ